MKRSIGKLMMFGAFAAAVVVTNPVPAFAHVVVSPNKALTGEYETFTTSVPNEKDIAVTGIRLVIPESVESVTPTVKPGWDIQTKKTGDKTTEITWTGGSIGPELRDEFTFSAHMPAAAGDINWKAYQTYQDGTVVAWDQAPSTEGHHSEDKTKGPYSTTTVSEEVAETKQTSLDVVLLYTMSIIALGLSVFAVIRTVRK